MSQPFATLHTTTTFPHARATKILAAAAMNNLTISIAPNFIYGETNKTETYLSKFPHGKIPALETASGFCLSEATAIALYLADSGPARDQLIGRTVEERALVAMWISLADTDIFISSGAIVSPIVAQSTYDADDVNAKEKEFIRALNRIEVHLAQEGKTWLVRDDEWSLADLSVAASLYWPLKLFMDGGYRGGFPRVMEWWERLMGVEAVGKGFEAPVALCEMAPARDGSFMEGRDFGVLRDRK